MADIQTVDIDIPVGDGPVTKTNRAIQWSAGFGGLAGLATFALSIAEVLPEGVDPIYGLVLTAVAGALSVVANFMTGKNRGQFADAKARIVEASYYASPQTPQAPVSGEAEVVATVGAANEEFPFDAGIPAEEVETTLVPSDYNGPVVEPND